MGQVGHGHEQPVNWFPWLLVALVPSSAAVYGNKAMVALGTGMSLVASDGEQLCSLGQSYPAKEAKAQVVLTVFKGKVLGKGNSRQTSCSELKKQIRSI